MWPLEELSEKQVLQLQEDLLKPAWLRQHFRPLKKTGEAYVLRSRRRATSIFGEAWWPGYVVRASRTTTAAKNAEQFERELPRAVLKGVSGESLVQDSTVCPAQLARC